MCFAFMSALVILCFLSFYLNITICYFSDFYLEYLFVCTCEYVCVWIYVCFIRWIKQSFMIKKLITIMDNLFLLMLCDNLFQVLTFVEAVFLVPTKISSITLFDSNYLILFLNFIIILINICRIAKFLDLFITTMLKTI